MIHKETLADALVLASLVPNRATGIKCIDTLMNQIIFSVLSGLRVTLRCHGQFRQKVSTQTPEACNYGPRKASSTKSVVFRLSKDRRIKILPR